jgi:hypothetical protein
MKAADIMATVDKFVVSSGPSWDPAEAIYIDGAPTMLGKFQDS